VSSLVNKFLGTAGLQMFSKGLIAFSGVIFARYLGPEEFGRYTFIMSIVLIVGLPVAAGLPNLLIREVANYHLDGKWGLLSGVINWSRWYIFKVSSFMVGLMLFGFHLDIFDNEVEGGLWVAICLIPLRGLLTQQGAILNGLRRPILSLLPMQILSPIIILILLFLMVFLEIDFQSKELIVITVIASFFAFLLSINLLSIINKKEIKKSKSQYNKKSWNSSLLPFALIVMISTFNTELAVFFLGLLGNTESVAYFKVAMQATILISLGLSSVNTVIMPNVARYFKQGDIQKTQELLTKSVQLSLLVSLPILLTLVVFGDFLIQLLFGPEYIDAYPILIILCVGQFANVIMGSVGAVLYMTHNEKKALKSLVISLTINLLLLVILIPLYSEIGAAIATSITMIVWNILMAKEVKFLTGLKTWFSNWRYYAK
jgi:O-antigen/teichoic acid export membrane protein